MSILDAFPEFKVADILIERRADTVYVAGEPVYQNTTIYTGKGWFYKGGDSEIFGNQQVKNEPSWKLILDPRDVTTVPRSNDVLTVDGVAGYRLGAVTTYFDQGELYFYDVNRKEGV